MTINIPENLSEISLSQYLKFYNSIKDSEGSDDYEQVSIEMGAKYLCDIEPEVLYTLPIETLIIVKTSIADLIKSATSQTLIKSFELGGIKYGFIPDLHKIQYGEYLDLVTYSKKTWDNISTIMSILYRPIVEEKGSKYRITKYEGTDDDTIELFDKKLTMDIVFGALSFFFDLQVESLNNILHYSVKTIEKGMNSDSQLKMNLQQNGVDMQALQRLQTMISSSLMQ